MKRYVTWIVVLTLVTASSRAGAGVGLTPAISAGMDVTSEYCWRGMRLTDGATVQPFVGMGLGDSGLQIDIWGSYALRDRDLQEGADEVDITASYSRELGAVGLTASAGMIQYLFPAAEAAVDHTQEVFVGLEHGDRLAPSITAYYDYDLFDSVYLAGAVAPSFPLRADGALALETSLLLGVSDFQQPFGFHELTARAGLAIDRGPVGITPWVSFSLPSDDVQPDGSFAWAGATIEYGF